ncbi:porin [Aliikangiella marina]|uniref:Porin n=1 Tax=Aliikangiella marina TaxID=1712262 RepID=A0A545TE18_9GAMM|nr:porin [Aliikangiella marina]TQV75468.1 porin [Aliikangiella marina]
MKLKYLLPAVALFATQANAEVNINGFATIAGGFTSDETETLYQYGEDLNFDNDSLFGVQLSSDLDEDLNFTAQLISRGRDEWATDVEWAYMSYQANENVRFQFGKQRTPYFMYTEFFDVGFAYHWIAPPAGVYDLPLGTVTGLNTILSGSTGSVEHTFEILFGQENADAFLDGQNLESEIKDLFLFSWTVNYDWLMLRASQTTADITLEVTDLDPLLAGWRQTPFASVADALEFTEDEATFTEFGMRIELGDFQLIAEVTEFESDDNFTGDQESYFVSAAYRIDTVTLHLTYGADETDNDFSALAGVPAGVDPGLDALLAASNLTLQSRFEDATYTTVGFRWDFNPAAALKVEYTDLTDDQFGQDASLLRFAVTTFF